MIENSPLNGKRILLFAVYTFNYQNIICDKLKELGAEVFLYDERSVSSAYEKALLKINPYIFKNKTKRYYSEILKKHEGEQFDYILFIKCDMPDQSVLREIKIAFPDAKLCLHVWDSIENIPHILEKVDLFDHCTSFDRKDSEDYSTFKFRPLFFADEFRKTHEVDQYKYDVSFCGTIHSDRYRILKSISKQCESNNMKYFGFHYLQSKFVYYIYKIFKREYRNNRISDFDFVKKTSIEVSQIIEASRCVIDIHHPRQTGLTMRTIEMLGMKKKLITTNLDIENYDFYNTNNICIIDRKNPVLEESFFNKPYIDINKEILEKYSLKSWIYDVLGIF